MRKSPRLSRVVSFPGVCGNKNMLIQTRGRVQKSDGRDNTQPGKTIPTLQVLGRGVVTAGLEQMQGLQDRRRQKKEVHGNFLDLRL